MGRLQRKKTAEQKKKKRTKAVDETSDVSENVVVEKREIAKTVFSRDVGAGKKSGAGVKASKSKGQSDNFYNKSIQFLREVKIELKKVTWPSRTQTMGTTAVVIVLVIIISLFLGLVDLGLTKLVSIVLR